MVTIIFWNSLVCAKKGIRLKLATTTSVENSGLLNLLLPPFEKRFGIKVDVLPLGTGKALKLAENGDVDIVFVHNSKAEEKFVQQGFGVNRREIMFNNFVIVGPADDIAKIKGISSSSKAFKRIAQIKSTNENNILFVSRGDQSGTNIKEIFLWEKAGIKPSSGKDKWYLETGQGMGATLVIANEKRAYCLVDMATFIYYQKKIEMIILCESDPLLYNPYSVIAVNPVKQSHVNYKYAMALIKWLTSVHAKQIIANYKINGQMLFHPIN